MSNPVHLRIEPEFKTAKRLAKQYGIASASELIRQTLRRNLKRTAEQIGTTVDKRKNK